MKIGVLALQGDFAAHAQILARLGQPSFEVRKSSQLADCDGLIIPGGESTSLRIIARNTGMLEPLRNAAGGLPIFGTCAGLIACAARLADGEEPILGHIDITVTRNAYGRQNESFETQLDFQGLGSVEATFIRAPRIDDVGDGVAVLSSFEASPVAVRQGQTWLLAFHPEVSGEDRIHAAWLDSL
jgi:pyridoxal 5'-phosphate synthase pdxT subunit